MSKAKSPSDPMVYRTLAEKYLRDVGHTETSPAVRWWRRTYWFWTGSRWVERDFNSAVLVLLKWLSDKGISSLRSTAEGVAHMLGALTRTEGITRLPCWWPPVSHSMGTHWVAMKNALVNPEKLARGDGGGGIHPITSRWFSTVALPYNYDPEATCNLWLTNLNDRLSGDGELFRLYQEFFGYWAVPDTREHAALILIGESGTGKTATLEVAEMFLGRENCSHVPLADFNKNFALIETNGKLLNIADETGELPKSGEHIIKWYVSGRPISVDGKYQPRFSMTPTARLVVGVNAWPRFHDMTGGIWRRLHVVPFRKVIPYERKITGYAERHLEERSGIFNWAVRGLRRLREQGRFTVTKAGQSELAIQQLSLQTHREFIYEHLIADEAGFIPNTILEGFYKTWCLINGLEKTASLPDLQREIAGRFPGVNIGVRRYHAGRRQRGILGITYVSETVDGSP